MRKLLSSIVAFAMMSFSLTAFAAELSFSDVAAGDDNTVAIEYLVAVGTLNGYSDGTFQPDRTISRSELMKVLVLGQGIDPADGEFTPTCFSDVEADDWFEPYVCYALDQDWVKGYDDGTFRPKDPVSRAEAAKMIVNGMAFNQDDDDMRFVRLINDVDEDDWFAVYVNQLKRTGVWGTGTSFDASGDMTRGIAASWLFRVRTVNETEFDYYNTESREAFLAAEGRTELVDLAYTASEAEADIYVTLQSYGDLTITNMGDSEDLTGWTLEDTFGDFVYTFSGVWSNGDSVDVATNGLLDTMPGLYLYDESGNWQNSWTTY